MWEKIKGILAVIGAVLTVIACTFFLVFLRRRDSDGYGSTGDDERDSAIQEGIADCEGRAERVEERLDSAGDAVARCEEHLQRAEDILRNAINRSKKEKSES